MMNEDGDEVIFCYGGAKPDDTHLLAEIVAIDGEIVALLEGLPIGLTDARR